MERVHVPVRRGVVEPGVREQALERDRVRTRASAPPRAGSRSPRRGPRRRSCRRAARRRRTRPWRSPRACESAKLPTGASGSSGTGELAHRAGRARRGWPHPSARAHASPGIPASSMAFTACSASACETYERQRAATVPPSSWGTTSMSPLRPERYSLVGLRSMPSLKRRSTSFSGESGSCLGALAEAPVALASRAGPRARSRARSSARAAPRAGRACGPRPWRSPRRAARGVQDACARGALRRRPGPCARHRVPRWNLRSCRSVTPRVYPPGRRATQRGAGRLTRPSRVAHSIVRRNVSATGVYSSPSSRVARDPS